MEYDTDEGTTCTDSARRDWLILMVAALNYEYALGKQLPAAFLPMGPPTAAQSSALVRLAWCVERLVLRDPGKLRAIDWETELKGKMISYDGQEVQTAANMTLTQLAPGLPSRSLVASIPAEGIASGEVRRCLLDPSRVLLPESAIPDAPRCTRVWADEDEYQVIGEHLEDAGIFRPISDPDVPTVGGEQIRSGAFGVVKPKDAPVALEDGSLAAVLRLVLNLIAANRCQRVIGADIAQHPSMGQWHLLVLLD